MTTFDAIILATAASCLLWTGLDIGAFVVEKIARKRNKPFDSDR